MRKRMAAKLAPKKYSDRFVTEHQGELNAGVDAQAGAVDVLVQSRCVAPLLWATVLKPENHCRRVRREMLDFWYSNDLAVGQDTHVLGLECVAERPMGQAALNAVVHDVFAAH